MTSDAVEPILRHHAAEAGVMVAAPIEPVPAEIEAEPPRRGFEDANPLGDHFLADSVAFDHCNAVSRHAFLCPDPARTAGYS